MLYRPWVPSLLTSLAMLLPVADAQSNLHLNLTMYSTDRCCGAQSVEFNFIKEGQCVETRVDTSIYGQTIRPKGLWYNGGDGPWDLRGWGFVRAYSTTSNCKGPYVDFYIDQCWTNAVEDRPRSFKWYAYNYTFFPLPWVPPPIPEDRQVEGAREAPTRKPDVFKYFDEELGRSRKLPLEGSEDKIAEVLGYHQQGNFNKLRSLPEIV